MFFGDICVLFYCFFLSHLEIWGEGYVSIKTFKTGEQIHGWEPERDT